MNAIMSQECTLHHPIKLFSMFEKNTLSHLSLFLIYQIDTKSLTCHSKASPKLLVHLCLLSQGAIVNLKLYFYRLVHPLISDMTLNADGQTEG